MKKVLSILLAALLVLALFAGCGKTETPAEDSKPADSKPADTSKPADEAKPADETPVSAVAEVTDTTYDGPAVEYTVNLSSTEERCQSYLQAFAKITERTDGKVTFQCNYSGSLMAASETLDGLGVGIADFSDVALQNYTDQFPYCQQVLSYPFLGIHSLAMGAEVISEVIPNTPAMLGEFEQYNIHPLSYTTVWGTAIACADDIEITTPESVKGKKFVTDAVVLSQFMNDVGITPVNQPVTEFYSSMTNGIADGLINALNVINIFGGLQPAKHVYLFENSATTGLQTFCVNMDTWNAMDENLRQIFVEEFSSEDYWNFQFDYWAVNDQSHLDDAAAWGIPVETISGADMQAWVDGMKPYGDNMLKELESKGYTECYAVLDAINEGIANYKGVH